MSKKLRKAVASIAAAALCAVSAMSTTINADAATNKRATYRTYFYFDYSGANAKNFDSLEVQYYSAKTCPASQNGAHNIARTGLAGVLNNFTWNVRGSGTSAGSTGIVTMKKTTTISKSGMLFAVASEASDTSNHNLAWAIGNENSNNSGARIKYAYKIFDKDKNIIGKSSLNNSYSKTYEDTDKNVLNSTKCVKTMTVLIGDVDLSGTVDSTDRTLIDWYVNKGIALPTVHKSLGGKMQSYYAADLNGDGKVDKADISVMDNYLKGSQRLINCQNS